MSSLDNILIHNVEPSLSDDLARDPPSQKRPAPRGTASYARKRAVTACQVCRARKTKCDNLKPSCSFCLSTGAVCIQSSVDLSSFDPASLKILEKLDDLAQLIQSNQTKNSDATPPTVHEKSVSLPERDLLPSSVEELLARDEFASLALTDQSQSPQQYHTPHVPVISPAWEDDLNAASTTALLDNFFENVHVKNPVLDEANTRRMVSRLAIHGFDQSSQSCLALLICALGSISSTFGIGSSHPPNSSEYLTAMSYFQAASKRLGPLLVDGGLVAAQCLFLSGVFMATIFRASSAWRYFLQALACCQEFRTVKWPGTTMNTLEDTQSLAAEQAVYWSAWKSEREMRGDMKLFDFPMQNTSSYPSFFPTPPAPPTENTTLEDAIAKRQRLSWYFYLSEISLKRLATRIQQEIAQTETSSSEKTLEALAGLEPGWQQEAQDWLQNLPQELNLESPSECDDICKFILRGHLLNVFELMYWPFVMAAINAKKQEAMVSQSILALATKGLQTHFDRLVVNQPGFYHRHHGTMFMLSACTRSALVLVLVGGLAPHGSSTYLSLPENWRWHVQQCATVNKFWQSDDSTLGRWGHALDLACMW